ncbi:MAG TPA: non-oxidative hydroxyarylic acid decarboxylases subunit D [Selenomonadales bacterium]|nr:non-oxidative hydroxyarylic acid decarboxylases subunit D [Selenomonadales bacterium]
MICPRCDGDTAEKLIDAPKDKCWEVFFCRTCQFSWRSTEDEAITNPSLYDQKFKLDPAALDKLLAIPPIPPLKKTR